MWICIVRTSSEKCGHGWQLSDYKLTRFCCARKVRSKYRKTQATTLGKLAQYEMQLICIINKNLGSESSDIQRSFHNESERFFSPLHCDKSLARHPFII